MQCLHHGMIYSVIDGLVLQWYGASVAYSGQGTNFILSFCAVYLENAAVNELLKLVHVRQSYHKKSVLVFFE